jgi:hypothetical protein
MPKPNDETVRLVEDLLEALAELRQTTRSTETVVRRALKLARSGADLRTALQACTPVETRHSMNEALKAVEAARHTMRLRIFELGLDEGLSIGELGRIFGFSRQLASRYASEARALRN